MTKLTEFVPMLMEQRHVTRTEYHNQAQWLTGKPGTDGQLYNLQATFFACLDRYGALLGMSALEDAALQAIGTANGNIKAVSGEMQDATDALSLGRKANDRETELLQALKDAGGGTATAAANYEEVTNAVLRQAHVDADFMTAAMLRMSPWHEDGDKTHPMVSPHFPALKAPLLAMALDTALREPAMPATGKKGGKKGRRKHPHEEGL